MIASGGRGTSGPTVLESVELVFQIIDQLVAARRPLGVTDVAHLLGQPKPRIYRHLASLRQVGVIEQDPVTEKYRLGAKLVVYGTAASEQFDLRVVAAQYLSELRDATGHTALVSVVENRTALVVATAESMASVCISVKPGTRLLAHCSAQGRIALAYASEPAVFQQLNGKLEGYTPASMTDPTAIRRRLSVIRERLYEEADGEVTPGINALAAPIFRGESTLVGTIGVLGTNLDIPSPPPEWLIAKVQSAAGQISRHLNNKTYESVLTKRRRGSVSERA